MSISAISQILGSIKHNHTPAAGGLQSSIQDLSSALQSGNLSSAQQSFSAIQSSLQAIEGRPAAAGGQASSIVSELQQGLSKIGSDLKAGDVSGAQTDFSHLKQQVKSALEQSGAVFHHHHGPQLQPLSDLTALDTDANPASIAT